MSAGWWADKRAVLLMPGHRVQFAAGGRSGTIVRAEFMPGTPGRDVNDSTVCLHLMPLHSEDTLPPQQRVVACADYVRVYCVSPVEG